MPTRKKTILLIGSSRDCPDLEYASGFCAVDPVVYLLHGREQHLVVPEMELGRAQREARHVKVWTPKGLHLRGKRGRHIASWATAITKRCGSHQVRVAATFPLGVARNLEKHGIHVVVSKTPLFPGRAVKTPEELRYIRESQQAAVIAMRSAMTTIAATTIERDGTLSLHGRTLTSEDIHDGINRTLLEHGCICTQSIVAGGPQGADPHERGTGPLRGHEPIVIDIFPQHLTHGYWGDLTRTVMRGHPPARTRRMYSAVKAAQSASLKSLKPGVRCSTVHAASVNVFNQRGFETRMAEGRSIGFIHSTGHGLGLEVHEAPGVSTNDTRLRAGHVITIEPGLYYPDTGGIRIEDTVQITREGWRYFVPCEKKLEL